MIGLDTNVVVRYLVQDDPDQSAVASAVIDELTETNPGYLSLVTVVELHWVLRRAYRVSAGRCAELLEGLLDARELRVDQDAVVRAALSTAPRATRLTPMPIVRSGRDCSGTVRSNWVVGV